MLQPTPPAKLPLLDLLIRGSDAVRRDVAKPRALRDVVHAPVTDVARVVVQPAVRGVAPVELAGGEFAPGGYASCVRGGYRRGG